MVSVRADGRVRPGKKAVVLRQTRNGILQNCKRLITKQTKTAGMRLARKISVSGKRMKELRDGAGNQVGGKIGQVAPTTRMDREALKNPENC